MRGRKFDVGTCLVAQTLIASEQFLHTDRTHALYYPTVVMLLFEASGADLGPMPREQYHYDTFKFAPDFKKSRDTLIKEQRARHQNRAAARGDPSLPPSSSSAPAPSSATPLAALQPPPTPVPPPAPDLQRLITEQFDAMWTQLLAQQTTQFAALQTQLRDH